MIEILNDEIAIVTKYKNTDSGNQDCGSRKYEITFPHDTLPEIVIREAIKLKALLIGKCNGNGGGKYYIKGYPGQPRRNKKNPIKSYNEAKNDIEKNLIEKKYKTHDVYLIKYKN
jgi:hypothetical protein